MLHRYHIHRIAGWRAFFPGCLCSGYGAREVHAIGMARALPRSKSHSTLSSLGFADSGEDGMNESQKRVVFAPGVLPGSPQAPPALSEAQWDDGASYSRLVLDSMAESLPQPPKKLLSIWREFAQFAFQGSIMDLSAGIIIGGAFGRIVTSFVNDVVMPPIGWVLSGVDFQNLFVLLKRGKKNRITKGRYKSLQVAKEDGAVTVNVGVFLNSVINFVALSVIIFVMVRTLEKFKQQGKKHKQTRKCCPECFMKIDQRALRCPYCTSDVTLSEPHLVEGTDTVTESDAFQKGMKPKKLMKKQLSRELGWKT